MSSPLDWGKDPRPSILAQDKRFAANKLGTTQSEMASQRVERIRSERGVNPGTIYGLSVSRGQKLADIRPFWKDKR